MANEEAPQAPLPRRQRAQIPLWVALAGMLVAFLLAIIIMANILRPLVNLVFPTEAKPPLPPETVLLEEFESRTSDGEWLYGTDADGCEVAAFYIEQGSECVFQPFACIEDSEPRTTQTSVATCAGTKSDVVNSFSWEVLIGSGYSDSPYTRFRVYLYRERD